MMIRNGVVRAAKGTQITSQLLRATKTTGTIITGGASSTSSSLSSSRLLSTLIRSSNNNDFCIGTENVSSSMLLSSCNSNNTYLKMQMMFSSTATPPPTTTTVTPPEDPDASADALDDNTDTSDEETNHNNSNNKENNDTTENITLYVGNISFETTEEALVKAFSGFGSDVVDIFLPKQHGQSGRRRGFAFVTVTGGMEVANTIITTLNESKLMEHTIVVNIANPLVDHSGGSGGEFNAAGHQDVRLYIGGMNVDTTTKESVTELFQEYGTVSDCHISERSRGYAFVTMPAKNAELACKQLNDTDIDGHTVRVNEAAEEKNRRTGGGNGFNSAGLEQVRLYVGGIPFDTDQDIVALKDSLKELFQKYGKVLDCYLPTDYQTGRPRGFAFVSMAANDAEDACQQLDDTEFGGRTLRINESRPKANNNNHTFFHK